MSRIYTALLLGLGITALVCLSVNIPIVGFFLAVLLMPGAMPAVIFPRVISWDSVPLLLAGNVLFYSGLAYVLILLRFHAALAARLRSISIWLVPPVMALCCLACIPRINPLLPVGMAELSRRESDLRSALPIGSRIGDARTALKSRGIEFAESVENSDEVIFEHGDEKIAASSGDQVIASSVPTAAYQFPCGYKLQIVLLFGPDDIMKERHIRRFPICP